MSSPSLFLVRRAKSARLSPHLIWRKRETARSLLPFEPLLGRIEDGAPLDCKAGVFCNTNDDTINVLQPSGRLKPPEGGKSRMKGGGDTCGKFWIKALKKTNLGVAQPFFFLPLKDTILKHRQITNTATFNDGRHYHRILLTTRCFNPKRDLYR